MSSFTVVSKKRKSRILLRKDHYHASYTSSKKGVFFCSPRFSTLLPRSWLRLSSVQLLTKLLHLSHVNPAMGSIGGRSFEERHGEYFSKWDGAKLARTMDNDEQLTRGAKQFGVLYADPANDMRCAAPSLCQLYSCWQKIYTHL